MDPIDNVLGMLNRKGGIDPGAAGKRKAALKQQRTAMGGGVLPQLGQPDIMSQLMGNQTPVGPMAPIPDQISPEEGADGQMMAPASMMPTILDGLNEAIIALKIEIHRSRDPEQKKQLERQANKIRSQIHELGGDPIRADESIAEGMQKLTGHGEVGGNVFGAMDVWNNLGLGSSPTSGGLGGIDPMQQESLKRPGLDFLTPRQGWYNTDDKNVRRATRSSYQGYDVATQGDDDFLSKFMRNFTGGNLPAAPTASLNIDVLNKMIADAGLSPRSPEEIQAIANDIVERQKFGQEAAINKQLARFEANWPNEFEQAKDQMRTAAADVKAENQEEMATRGLYYSSIMGGSLQAIDAQTMDLIGDIASQAAEYVAGLNHDMKDLEQWAVLEQAVTERHLEMEDRQMQLQLTGMKIQVMQFADQYALDVWATQTQAALQQQQMALQHASMAMQAYAMQQDMTAYAHMVNDPTIREMLQNMGIDGKYFSSLPLSEQSQLIQNLGFVNHLQSQQLANQEAVARLFLSELTNKQFEDNYNKRLEELRAEQATDEPKLKKDKKPIKSTSNIIANRSNYNLSTDIPGFQSTTRRLMR